MSNCDTCGKKIKDGYKVCSDCFELEMKESEKRVTDGMKAFEDLKDLDINKVPADLMLKIINIMVWDEKEKLLEEIAKLNNAEDDY